MRVIQHHQSLSVQPTKTMMTMKMTMTMTVTTIMMMMYIVGILLEVYKVEFDDFEKSWFPMFYAIT